MENKSHFLCYNIDNLIQTVLIYRDSTDNFDWLSIVLEGSLILGIDIKRTAAIKLDINNKKEKEIIDKYENIVNNNEANSHFIYIILDENGSYKDVGFTTKCPGDIREYKWDEENGWTKYRDIETLNRINELETEAASDMNTINVINRENFSLLITLIHSLINDLPINNEDKDNFNKNFLEYTELKEKIEKIKEEIDNLCNQ